MKDATPKDLDELHMKARRARSKLEPTWFMNLSYYIGEQWIGWNGNSLYKPQLKANRITLVDNRIQPCVRTEVAKMTKKRPVFTVSPRTADEEDLNASELAEQMMRYLWKHLNMQELTMKALMWSRITGAGFLKCFWDPTLGDGTDVVVGPDGKVLSDASGKALRPKQVDPQELSKSLGVQVKSKRVSQGDIRVEVRSPFQMFVDPLCDSFPEADWIIEESVKSVESAQRMYGVSLQADTTSNPGLLESRMGLLLPGTSDYKGAKIREYWCRANSDHPNGRHAVWSQGKILLEEDNPFDSLPYVMLSGIPVPGRLWPTCIVEQLRPSQTELNKVKSQIAENRNRVGNPTILASKQAVQDPDKFVQSTTMPGGVYFFDDLGSPNTVPTYLQAPPLPQYVVDEIARIEESIQEISGQHEVTSANVPPGVTAASAINLLQEADDTRLGPMMTDYEFQLGKLGQKILKLAAHYYTDARSIRIAGDNGVWQIFDFRGSMLRDNTHVEVQAGSAFPQSKAAKQAWMQDMLTFFVQSGNPPHGKQLAQFLQDQDVGGAERMIEEYTMDERQAERENSRMVQNQRQHINDFDNDQAHIDAHQDFQKQQRYEQLSAPVQQLFEAHVQEHKARLAAQQQAEMQLQQGGPPGMPQPGQPGPGGSPGSPAGAGGPPGGPTAGGGQDPALTNTIAQAQAQHGLEMTGAQQGQKMALDTHAQDQQQRHAEDKHLLSSRHADEAHMQKQRHAEELHQANLKAKAQQDQQNKQPTTKPGGSNVRREG